MNHNPAECVKCGRGHHVRGPEFAGYPIWQWVCCKSAEETVYAGPERIADAGVDRSPALSNSAGRSQIPLQLGTLPDEELQAAREDKRQMGLPL